MDTPKRTLTGVKASFGQTTITTNTLGQGGPAGHANIETSTLLTVQRDRDKVVRSIYFIRIETAGIIFFVMSPSKELCGPLTHFFCQWSRLHMQRNGTILQTVTSSSPVSRINYSVA